MKKLTVLLLASFVLSLNMYASEKKNEGKKFTSMEEYNKYLAERTEDSWRANIKLKDTSIKEFGYLGVLCSSTVEKDPMELFKKELKMMAKYFSRRSNLAEAKEMDIQFAWDKVFDTVKGSRVWFLPESSKDKLYYNSISGDVSPKAKKRWLVTQAVGRNGKTVCWSIPLKPEKGKTVDITLTDDNAIHYKELEKIYDSIVK
jgi:hypothetical protein